MSSRTRSVISRAGPSTETIESIPVPSHYDGVYSPHVINIIEASNKFLSQCRAADAAKVRKVCSWLLDLIRGWNGLSPIDTLIQLASIRDKVQETATQIGRLTKQDFDAIPVDFEGIRRSFRNLINDPTLLSEARELQTSRAELLLGSLQVFLDGKPGDHDREDVVNLLKDLSDATNALPCNIILQEIYCDEDVFRDKGYAVVHKGDYRGVEVAVTTVQEVDHTPHVSQRWRRQIVSWRQLNHENVARIIGVCQDVPYSLVSEFQPQINIREFLKNCETENQPPDYAQLLDGITAGLEYLHSRTPPITHGDLRGQNILVTSEGVAEITDYGLARFQHNVQRSSSFYSQGTSIRWMAPEISEDPECSNTIIRSTLESDVYSLGMTIFEIITGEDPFADMDDVSAVRTHVQRNGRPTTPPGLDASPLLRYMSLVDECWKQRAEDRVTIQDTRLKLAEIDSPSPASEPADSEPLSPAGTVADNFPVYEGNALGLQPIPEKKELVLERNGSPASKIFSLSEDSKSEAGALSVASASSPRKKFPAITKRLPFAKAFMRRRKQQPDSSSERRVAVSVDVDTQDLVVTGSEGDVEQVACELEYVIGIVQRNYLGNQLSMSRRAIARLSIEDARETARIASLNAGDLSVRVDPERGKIFFLGPRDNVLSAREETLNILEGIENETTVYFNADPKDLPQFRTAINQIVKRCRTVTDKVHHEVFIRFPSEDSPSSTIRVDGEPTLVDAILSAYESGDWKNDIMATIDCPVSRRTLYALMRSRVHQLPPLEEVAHTNVALYYLPPEEPENQTIRLIGTRRACGTVVDVMKERIGMMRREIFIFTSPSEERLAELGLREELEGVRVVCEALGPEDRAGYASDPVWSVWVLTAVNKIDMKLAVNLLKRPEVVVERWTPPRQSHFSASTSSDGGAAVSPIMESIN